MFRGYFVVWRPCNHGGIFPEKEVFSFENLRTKIHSLTGPMICGMLRTIFNGSSCFLFALKYHILPGKSFVVRLSYSDYVTTAAFPLK